MNLQHLDGARVYLLVDDCMTRSAHTGRLTCPPGDWSTVILTPDHGAPVTINTRYIVTAREVLA